MPFFGIFGRFETTIALNRTFRMHDLSSFDTITRFLHYRCKSFT